MASKLEKEIIQKMDGTKTFGQIGQEFGLSYQTIKGIAEINGIPRPKTKSPTRKFEEAILKRLKKGDSLKVISEKFCMTQTRVRNLALSNNFSITDNKNKKILEALKTAKSYSEVSKKLSVASSTVRKIALVNNINIKGRVGGGLDKTERNTELVALIKEGNMTYPQLGKKFGVSKQRIYQFAIANGISRWKLSRERNKSVAEAIEYDYQAGLSYDDIKSKYDFSKIYPSELKQYGYVPLAGRYRKDRDAKIVEEYKRNTAKVVLGLDDPLMDNPDRLSSINSVYSVNRRAGFKKYPNVGNRNGGGVFENPKVIKIIKKKREKNNLSFKDIADILNAKGYKTPMGKAYTCHNLRSKYHAIVKHNK